jgi:hypothetical protein
MCTEQLKHTKGKNEDGESSIEKKAKPHREGKECNEAK